MTHIDIVTGPDRCFRCGDEVEAVFCHSSVNIWNADASFSGVFKFPLCYGCSCIPHNSDYERLLPR